MRSTPPPHGLLLSDVLPDAKPLSVRDIRFTSCSTRANSVHAGDLFVATDEGSYDGHDQAQQAIQRGASALIVERMLPVSVPQFLVDDSRHALARIGHALCHHPSREMNVIAVIDSSQVTAPSVLGCSVLERGDKLVSLANDMGSCDGYRTRPHGTPFSSPLQLADWLTGCQASDTSHVVLGTDVRTIQSRALDATQLGCVVLTGLESTRGPGRVDARRAIARLLENLSNDTVVIYNADNPNCRSVIEHAPGAVISYGLHQDADVRGEVIECLPGNQTLLIDTPQEVTAVETRPFGDQYARFCLASVALGQFYGVSMQEIAIGLERVESIPLLLEPLHLGQAFGVYLDTANDPHSLRRALATMQQAAQGKVICVATAPSELTSEERAVVGTMLESMSDRAIITAKTDEVEPSHARKMLHDVVDGYASPQKATVIPTREHAIRQALQIAADEDAVLITGCRSGLTPAGMETSERTLVRDCLNSNSRPALTVVSP